MLELFSIVRDAVLVRVDWGAARCDICSGDDVEVVLVRNESWNADNQNTGKYELNETTYDRALSQTSYPAAA